MARGSIEIGQEESSGGARLVQRNASRSFQDCAHIGARSSRRAAALKKRVIAASRMPELPSTHRKIIVRPRDGLDLSKTSCYGISTAIFTAAGITAIQASTDLVCPNVVQNIVVVCTEKEDNAGEILALKSIRVNGKEHEVAVYAAAEGNYVKGVIRNVERDIDDAQLSRLIVHQRNPSVRGVKRIKETGSVVVLFDGGDVPSYIRVLCYLYKKADRGVQQVHPSWSSCGRLPHSTGQRVPQLWGPRTRSKDTCARLGANSAARATLRETKPAKRSTRHLLSFDRGERNEKWNVLSTWTCGISPRSRPGSLGRLRAAGCNRSPWEVDPRFPSARNGPPRRIQNLTEHKLHPPPR
ncbi:hypothetical protein MTO96_020391 [Rhipicephalus appendiculatus]